MSARRFPYTKMINAGAVPWTRPVQLPSTYFPVPNSLIILSFHSILYSEWRTDLLNKLWPLGSRKQNEPSSAQQQVHFLTTWDYLSVYYLLSRILYHGINIHFYLQSCSGSTSHVNVMWRTAVIFTRYSTPSFSRRLFILRESRALILLYSVLPSDCVMFYCMLHAELPLLTLISLSFQL